MIEFGDKLLTLAGVPPQRIEECLEWAFGRIDAKESMEDLRQRWNKKHGDIFIVSKEDHLKAFVWSVGKAYVLRVLPDHPVIIQVARRGRGGMN